MQKKRSVWAILYFYQVYNAEKFLVKKKWNKKKKKKKKKKKEKKQKTKHTLTKKPRECANHMSVQNKEHMGTVLYFLSFFFFFFLNLEMIHVVWNVL